MSEAPLSGLVVLDVSSFIAAPAAAVVLADFGGIGHHLWIGVDQVELQFKLR